MKLIIVLLLSVLGLFLFVEATDVRPCKVPSQWRANVYDRDDKAKFRSRGELTYDAVNRRIRKVGIEKFGEYADYVDSIILYNENVEYRYSYTTKKCQKSTVKNSWLGFDLPQNASYYGEQTIGLTGASDSSLVASVWGASIHTDGQDFELLALLSKTNCVPITFYLDNDLHNYQAFFFNVNGKPLDADAFAIRSECL